MLFQRINTSERIISRLQRSFTFLESKKDSPFIIFLEPFSCLLPQLHKKKGHNIHSGYEKQNRITQSLTASQCNGIEPMLGETLAPKQFHCRSLRSSCLHLPILDFLALLQTVSPPVGITGQCFFYQIKTQRHSETLKMKRTCCCATRTDSHFLYNYFALIEVMMWLP